MFKYPKIYILFFLFFVACSKETILKNDAVRIKTDKTHLYNLNKYTNKTRNGNTLRGKAIKIVKETSPNSCPIEDTTTYKTNSYLMFLDSNSTGNTQIEKIPLSDLFLLGPELKMPKNKNGNINYFETYNDPLLPKSIKEIPVDSVFIDSCSIHCPCNDFAVQYELPCILCFKCPERELDDFFVETKLAYANYNNKINLESTVGDESISGEFAVGWRFGEGKRFGLGLLYSTGVGFNNTLTNINTNRPFLALYQRYDLIRQNQKIENIQKVNIDDYIYLDSVKISNNECLDTMIVIQRYKTLPETEVTYTSVRECWNPFIFGFIGPSLDVTSLNLLKMNCTEGCEEKLNLSVNNNYNFNLAINYGFGIGLEYPLSRKLDISFDLSYRYLSYGNNTIINGFVTPINQNSNAIVFRLGLTY